MGTAVGALKVAAMRVGLSVEEYTARVAQGEKWCTGCKCWHLLSEFAIDRSRSDGRMTMCRAYRGKRHQETYVPRPRPTPGRRYADARDGDTLQARARVNYLITKGLLAEPNELPCTDCGHLWRPGERRHEYDHHLGYEAEHHEDVEAVCTRCHHARERYRRAA